MIDIYGIDKVKNCNVDDVVRSAVKWHFSQETGSQFWIEKMKTLKFNPLTDVKTFKDLIHFDDYSDEMKTIDVDKLIPKGIVDLGLKFNVFESGGTTGSPQRIVDSYSRKIGLEWVDSHFDDFGLSEDVKGNWLHVGPSGPHIVGTSIGRLSQKRGKICFYIDFDPRWVKKAAKNKKIEVVNDYVQHILEQIDEVLTTQTISVMFVTPSVLQAISSNGNLMAKIREKIKYIIWAGTAMGEDNLDAYQNYLFPEITFMGLYGNTLMGIAPQRKPEDGDEYLCIYQPFNPFSIVEVFDESDNSCPTVLGNRGQVCMTLMTPDMFIPRHFERDNVAWVKSSSKYMTNGIADVRPLDTLKEHIFEGVY